MLGGMNDEETNMNILSDFWAYSRSTRQWAMLAGSFSVPSLPVHNMRLVADPTTFPGPRALSAAVVDGQGNLLLYGGLSCGTISQPSVIPLYFVFGDVFKYSPGNALWTWMAGLSDYYSAQSEIASYGNGLGAAASAEDLGPGFRINAVRSVKHFS
jgi:hypothetical protein